LPVEGWIDLDALSEAELETSLHIYEPTAKARA